MTEKLSILGSTGSIGTQALEVAEKLSMKISALAAYGNIELLEAQARKYKPGLVAVFDENKAKELKIKLADTDVKVLSGMDGLCEAAVIDEADTVLNSVVGMVGLKPTLCAIDAKKNIALANKETLVAGGSLVMSAVKDKGVALYPVDSEHSAIFQCLQGCNDKKELKKIILTASGGPFFGKSYDELRNMTPAQSLKHPNWSMGAKITIDSATMMNKGLEIIEAAWLFDMPEDKIDVVVHRESIIHSLIEYNDNSVIAQLGVPNMKIPIQYALTYPQRTECPVAELDLTAVAKMTFYKPDMDTFVCMRACREAIRKGGLYPAVANGANEQAVGLYLKNKILFTDIGELVQKAMSDFKHKELAGLDDILEADRWAREYVLAHT